MRPIDEPSRRGFLGGAAGAAALRLLGCGSSARSRHLLLIHAYGGWDATYTWDPKPGVPTIDVPVGDVEHFAGIPVWTDDSRPAAREFFARYADLCAVVNGIAVRSIAHSACLQRVLCGSAAAGSPDIAAIAGSELGADRPLPYLMLGAYGFAGTLAATSGRVGVTNQLATLLDPAQAYVTEAPVPHASDTDEGLVRRLVEARAARERALRGSTGENQARIDDFLSSLRRSDQLLALGGALGSRGELADLASQLDVALRAIETGTSSAVGMSAGPAFDDHATMAPHARSHEVLFDGLTLVIEELLARPGVDGGASLLDETLVVVTTEMGRTPRLNALGGKDHWPWTSMLLFGAGLRDGRVYGGTNDLLEGVPPGGRPLDYAAVAAGVLACLGIDPAAWLPEAEPFLDFVG